MLEGGLHWHNLTIKTKPTCLPGGGSGLLAWVASVLLAVAGFGQTLEVPARMQEGLGGEGLTFFLNDSDAAEVRELANPEGSPAKRRVLSLGSSSLVTELSTTVTGPGRLSYLWHASGGTAAMQLGSAPAPVTATAWTGWRRVVQAIPPGVQVLRWLLDATGAPVTARLDITGVVWEPQVLTAPAAAGLSRPGGRMWGEQRSDGGPVTVIPWESVEGGEETISINVSGPGLFVAEVRSLISLSLPHFAVVNEVGTIRAGWEGEAGVEIASSGGWRPVVLPVAPGIHTLFLSLAWRNDFSSPWGFMPAVLELRAPKVVPVQTGAVLDQPGLTWNAAETREATGARLPEGSTVWHLPPIPCAADPAPFPQLSARIDGPGTLEWQTADEVGPTSRDSGAGMRVLEPKSGISAPMRPAFHQLILPAGSHELVWRQESPLFRPPLPERVQCLRIRWLPSSRPALAGAASLPPGAFAHFVSEGGWEAVPFSLDAPRQRLRVRQPGTVPAPAWIALENTPAFSTWGTETRLDETGLTSTGQFDVGADGAITWSGPDGERGELVYPMPRIVLGELFSSQARAGETLDQWAARLGVAVDPMADDDGDGLQNILESALGLNPNFAEAAVSDIGSRLPASARFPWPDRVPVDVTRVIETSPDLKTWSPAAPVIAEGVAEVILMPPARFVRFRAGR